MLLEIFKFLYINFSYPLFFLIFTLFFSKDIKALLKRITSIEKNNKGMKFEFADVDHYFEEVNSMKEKIEENYGDTILNQRGGSGGVINVNNIKYKLVYEKDKLREYIEEMGIFETVKNLYISYESLKEKNNYMLQVSGSNIDNMLNNDFVIQLDELIEDFYNYSLEIKFENKVLKEKDVFNYQKLIKDSLVLRQNLVIDSQV